LAALCWAIWRTKNAVFLIKKSVKSPNEIIYLASSFIFYWSGLHKQGDKQDLEDGAQALKEAVLLVHQHQTAAAQTIGVALLQ
jgi:hypothetical protein